jgi:hypothetical protein
MHWSEIAPPPRIELDLDFRGECRMCVAAAYGSPHSSSRSASSAEDEVDKDLAARPGELAQAEVPRRCRHRAGLELFGADVALPDVLASLGGSLTANSMIVG